PKRNWCDPYRVVNCVNILGYYKRGMPMASFGLLYQLSQTILQMSMPMESFGYYKRGMPMASFCLFINFREQLYKCRCRWNLLATTVRCYKRGMPMASFS